MGAFPGVKMTSNGNSAIINVNPILNYNVATNFTPSWSLGLICTVSSGASLTYAVQVTGDQLPSANGNWNNHDVLNNETTSANGNVGFPITGIRLNVTNYVSGSINLGVVQWP